MRLHLLLVVLSSGCVLGPVRRVTVGPLQQYEDVKASRLEAPPGAAPLERALLDAVGLGLKKGGAGRLTEDASGFSVRVTILEAIAPAAPSGGPDVVGTASTMLGLTGAGAAQRGQLVFEARLFAPAGGGEVGYARWEGAGDPLSLASRAGSEAGEALALKMALRRHERFERRVADERLVLTPTASTLQPGTFFLSNDELLLFRAGVGVHRRVQLDFWLGGFGLPVGGGFALPVHMLVAGGGVAVGVVAVADIGLKFRLLDEGRYLPGLAASYDMLNVFGAAFGAGALVVGGKGGAAAAAAAGVATANLQFNVFTVTLSRHFGPVQLTAGAYVVDNHHWVPQTANVAVGLAATTGDTGGGTSSTPVDRVPTMWQPFFSAEWVLGRHSALLAELLPRVPVEETMVTTGVRWQLGWREPLGPWARDRIRFRLDLAGLWVYLPKTSGGSGGFIVPLPWAGLGLYFS